MSKKVKEKKEIKTIKYTMSEKEAQGVWISIMANLREHLGDKCAFSIQKDDIKIDVYFEKFKSRVENPKEVESNKK